MRQALGSKTAEVTDWGIEQIHRGVGAHSGAASTIHRLEGSARDHGDDLDWSLILKSLRPQGTGLRPSDWNYWRREVEVYQSGWLDDLPGGLTAPRCLGIEEKTDGSCWIWMEDVADHFASVEDRGPKWPIRHDGVVAHHLGQFNGAYLTGARRVPTWPWLRRANWMRERVERAGPALIRLQESVGHPVVRRAFPPEIVDSLKRRWAERDRYLDAIDHLPRTLFHGAAFRRNLFARHDPEGCWQTVAVDWVTVGAGWIGHDIRALIGSTLSWRDVDSSQARDLDRIVFEGYLQGLQNVGWQDDPRLARLGLTVTRCLGWLGTLPGLLDRLADEDKGTHLAQAMGYSPEGLADYFVSLNTNNPLAYWEDEARVLLEELGTDLSAG